MNMYPQNLQCYFETKRAVEAAIKSLKFNFKLYEDYFLSQNSFLLDSHDLTFLNSLIITAEALITELKRQSDDLRDNLGENHHLNR